MYAGPHSIASGRQERAKEQGFQQHEFERCFPAASSRGLYSRHPGALVDALGCIANCHRCGEIQPGGGEGEWCSSRLFGSVAAPGRATLPRSHFLILCPGSFCCAVSYYADRSGAGLWSNVRRPLWISSRVRGKFGGTLRLCRQVQSAPVSGEAPEARKIGCRLLPRRANVTSIF